MTNEKWFALKETDVIWNKTAGYNVIYQWDGELYLLSSDKNGTPIGNSLFHISQFDCDDWDMVIDGVIINE